MNWLHFSYWIAGLYLLYYLINILMDSARRPPAEQNLELTFSENVEPQKIEHLPDKLSAPKQDSAIISSGGVSLKNLFGLCKEEAILYTRPVSF